MPQPSSFISDSERLFLILQLARRTATRQAPLRLPTLRSLPARGFCARTSNPPARARETRNTPNASSRLDASPITDYIRGPRALAPTHRPSRGLRPRGPTPHFAASAVNERSARERERGGNGNAAASRSRVAVLLRRRTGASVRPSGHVRAHDIARRRTLACAMHTMRYAPGLMGCRN